MNCPINSVRVWRINPDSSVKNIDDEVIVEQRLLIKVKDIGEFTLLATPIDLEALVVGFLFAENIIRFASDVISLEFESGCVNVAIKNTGKIAAANKLPNSAILPNQQSFQGIASATITSLIEELQSRQEYFVRTGGAHAAGIFDQTGVMVEFAEDVARHNALDKAIGKLLLTDKNLQGHGVVLSSRVSFEMVAKVARAGFEIIASVSAPTSLAIEAAEQWQITLCSFVRNGRINIYSHQGRISK